MGRSKTEPETHMTLQNELIEMIAEHLEGKQLGGHLLRQMCPSENNGTVRFTLEDMDGEPTETEVVVLVATFEKG